MRIAAAADFFNWFQMDWVAEFLATHPKVRLEFVLSDARADLVAEGIDVAIRGGKVNRTPSTERGPVHNNPRKYDGIADFGLHIVGRVPLVSPPHEENAAYLKAKQVIMGHMLDLPA